MEFRVISFNAETAQIVVAVGEMRLAIDLPIDDQGCVPEGKVFEDHVMQFIPVEALRRQRLLARHGGVRNADAIARLIEPEFAPVEQTASTSDPTHFLTDIRLSSI